ncbi:BapA/Bap/LapF family large adhesin [Pedomonas sp. V897]|uniref:BapA/Bap/LapF family large adhesin n=1 Tax=Pedomonas sp. V897 TaxID=3446482 RepID=UPI003EDEA196
MRFNVDTDNNRVVLRPTVGGAVDLGVLSKYVLVIETQDEYGRWVRYEGDAQNVDNGLLRLDLLGLIGADGSVTLDDFPQGEYRAALVPDPELVNLSLIKIRSLSVEASDVVETHDVTVTSAAEGNFLEAATGGAVGDFKVTSVTINGITYSVPESGTTISGSFGVLVINAAGEYTYTPDPAAGVGVDTFRVTVTNSITGAERTGTLGLGSQLGGGQPAAEIEAGTSYDQAAVIVKPKATTTDYHDSKTILLDLGGLGQAAFSSYPKFDFTVNEGQTGFVSLTSIFGGVASVVEIARVQVQKYNTSTQKWENYSGLGDGGLLDLLGASGTKFTGTINFNDPGQYRIYAMSNSVLQIGVTIDLQAKVTIFDSDKIGGYGVQTASGNILDVGVVDRTTLVTHVNGQAVTSVAGKTIIEGLYGTLAIDVYGNYTYTPYAAGTGIGQVEEFTYRIRNAAGKTAEGKLYVSIDSPGQGLVWSEDPDQPAELQTEAHSDTGTAVIDSAYKVTTGGGTGHSESQKLTNGAQIRTATLTFDVDADTAANVRIVVASPGSTSNSVKWSITITGPDGYFAEFGKSDSSGGYLAGFKLDQVLGSLPPGRYTITATYEQTNSLSLVNGLAAVDRVTIDYNFVSVTHFDEFVTDDITPATGNVLDDDTLGSVFTKFLVKNEAGTFVEVVNGTTVVGDYGTLTINANGSYTYRPNADLEAVGREDVFTYRLQHPNGSVVDANLTISIEHGDGPYDPPVGARGLSADLIELLAFAGDEDAFADQGDDKFDVASLLEDGSGFVDLEELEIPENDEAPLGPEADLFEDTLQSYADFISPNNDLEEQF